MSGKLAWETQQLDYRQAPATQSSGPIIAGGKVVSGRSCRPNRGPHACVVMAHDAQTGKELWSSGDQIASWNHFSGLTVANGRVYIGTFDGILYCFGVKQ